MSELPWLAGLPDARQRIRALGGAGPAAWELALELAGSRLDFLLTNALDTVIRRRFPAPPADSTLKPVRLAILGSGTFAHLHGAIRVAGLRHALWIELYECAFGQYRQELQDPASALHRFQPTAILIALDGYHLAAGVNAAMDASSCAQELDSVRARIHQTWTDARAAFQCPILHQTVLPVFPDVLGSNEHRLPGSRCHFLQQLNQSLRPMADASGVDLVAIDTVIGQDGIAQWHDPTLWHHAKQEIAPQAAPHYGDLVVRVLAARQGLSRKCLVLDLDNTLWGGVIGDDGLDGIVLGQGSAQGETFVAFQIYVKELARRGVILAVCSKNDETNALEVFDQHPDMILRRADIACFCANWSDKAHNLREIARQLNIGIDSLVFVDDNPFERELVRRELPEVAVPELSDDPATFAQTVSDAGYFESIAITEEDLARSAQYIGNSNREASRKSATDLRSYLEDLQMRLLWKRFDRVGLQRIVQLINKSNQFNLTTRRYTPEQVLEVMADPKAFGLQLRLLDRFGDNGVIAIVIGRLRDGHDLVLDTWLMSCRVLGRQVEQATLAVIVGVAESLGATRLVGEYVPTKKNDMVRDHYASLGFTVEHQDPSGASRSILEMAGFVPQQTSIAIIDETVT